MKWQVLEYIQKEDFWTVHRSLLNNSLGYYCWDCRCAGSLKKVEADFNRLVRTTMVGNFSASFLLPSRNKNGRIPITTFPVRLLRLHSVLYNRNAYSGCVARKICGNFNFWTSNRGKRSIDILHQEFYKKGEPTKRRGSSATTASNCQ